MLVKFEEVSPVGTLGITVQPPPQEPMFVHGWPLPALPLFVDGFWPCVQKFAL